MLAEQLLLTVGERYITLCCVQCDVAQAFMYAVRSMFENLLYYCRVATYRQILERALSSSSAFCTRFCSQCCNFGVY